MADSFEILGAVGTVELVGGTKTQPVRQVTARAIPSAVIFTLVVAASDYTPQKIPLIFGTVADALNKCSEVPGVETINVYQDVNDAGQFVNKVDVGVTSSSGNSDETISVPYGSIFDDRFASLVGKARANMDAIEGL